MIFVFLIYYNTTSRLPRMFLLLSDVRRSPGFWVELSCCVDKVSSLKTRQYFIIKRYLRNEIDPEAKRFFTPGYSSSGSAIRAAYRAARVDSNILLAIFSELCDIKT